MSRTDGKVSEPIAKFIYEEAMSDAEKAGVREQIGAVSLSDIPPEFDPTTLYRPPFDAIIQGVYGNVVAEGLFTAGKGLTIQLSGREFEGFFDIVSALFVVSSTGERVQFGSVTVTNEPKYFELRIFDSVDLSNPQTTFWTLTDGWLPLSPALRNFSGSVNFSWILDETIEATAETYLYLSNCSATTAKLGAGSQVVVDSCSNLQTVILDFGDLEIESCNQLTNIGNASLTNYLSVVDCIAYGESVSGGDSGLRYFNNTGIVNFVATGNYNTLNFINNVDLVSVDLSRVTLCAFLLFTNNPNHNVDDMLNSIVNFAAFAGGVIGLDYPATSASQSAQDSLIAAGCAIIVN